MVSGKDDERLKRGTYLTEKYFDEQLERIREIRASERKFYQKITDLYATAIDTDTGQLFLSLLSRTAVIFFLCTVGCKRIIKLSFLHKLNGNGMMGKSD